MLVEYLPVTAQSDGETLGTKAHALDEILGDAGAVAVRIGHAAPEPVIQAGALSIALPGSDEILTLDDLVVESLHTGYALYSRDQQSTTSTTLVVMGKDVMGTIHHEGAVYGVQPLGDGLTAVYLHDAAHLREPPELEPDFVIPEAEPDDAALPLTPAPPMANDSRDQIDVLVAYTDSARRVAGNMDARIALLVQHTHLAYRNSGITTRLRVVHSYQTSYTPMYENTYSTSDRKKDLDRLRRPGDGYVDEALTKRDQYGADIVILVYRTRPDYCGGGVAYLLDHSAGRAEWAFGMSGTGTAGCSDDDGNTFAHEVGHIQGAAHNPEQNRLDDIDPNSIPYAYGHGFCNAARNWRTVMSYNTGSRCQPRIEYFSNPVVLYQGTATGDVQRYNVSRVINETAIHVANFRQSKTPSTPTLPMVPAASSSARQGFVRVINRSSSAGTVDIHAIDDDGRRFGPVSLSLEAKQTRHFTSQDLESGNPARGLSGGVGDGSGNWRLELLTGLDISARAYIRTPDGFLTSMDQVATETEEGSNRYHVTFFNPGKNRDKQSWLRLSNPGDGDADIVIQGQDDQGNPPPGGEVRLTLTAGAAHTLSAQHLEGLDANDDLSGQFGAGQGKWQLFVSADRPILVMNLMSSLAGHLTNLSSGQPPPFPPPEGPDLTVSFTVQPTRIGPGGIFNLFRATVRNQGTAPSDSTTMTVYRSPNATIGDGNDTHVWTAPSVDGLPPGGTLDRGLTDQAAPDQLGTYYYGACVDKVPNESNTGNNCSPGVKVIVDGGGPDLVVESPTVNNSSGPVRVNAGADFTFRATVRNQGTGPSASTDLRYYRSTNATITRGDVQVPNSQTTDGVRDLDPGETDPEDIRLTAPSSGTYYYGACVDKVPNESNTGNNCSPGVKVIVDGGSEWGAIAHGWRGEYCDDGYNWAAAYNYSDRDVAISRAESLCQSAGLINCTSVVAFSQCGAMAYGESDVSCTLYGGGGATRSAAEQDALSRCRSDYSDCRISVDTTNRRASYCNASAQSTPQAEAQSSSHTTDVPLGTLNHGSRPRPTPPQRQIHGQ